MWQDTCKSDLIICHRWGGWEEAALAWFRVIMQRICMCRVAGRVLNANHLLASALLVRFIGEVT